jgi:hypothetical protein
MFLKTEQAVCRTARIHGTFLPIDGGDVLRIEFNQGAQRVEPTRCLLGRGFLNTILFPRAFEWFSICAAREVANKKE